MGVTILLSLAGGLGLFLYGMKLMSEAIEKAAGAKLRSILEFFTTNRITGMLVGIVFTAIIQSSSACTVMVVSFVNSGLMTLYQAAGVILGANIGTTVTSQLVSFNLSEIAPVFLLGGVIAVMFLRNDMVKKIGEIVLGFGILFMGLSGMSGAMSGLRESPAVVSIFSSLSNPVLAVLLGTVVTAIMQSSSVTVSIVLLMANQGLLQLPICLFIILGCNIGACASAMLASLTGMKDAKRAALIHLSFNVIGTIIFFFIFLIGGNPIANWLIGVSGGNPGRAVANAHTTIKILQVIMLLPFTTWLVRLTYLLVPGDDQKVGYRDSHALQFIGDKVVFNPATAVVEVHREIERMGDLAVENLNRGMNVLITLDHEDIEEVYKVEENINFLCHSITGYLVKINQANLPIEDLKSIGALFHVVSDIERIGDHAENMADAAKQRIESEVDFSEEGIRELAAITEKVDKILHYAVSIFSTGNDENLQKVLDLEDEIDEMERQFQRNHVERLSNNICHPLAGIIFAEVISNLERVGDHATNIAFANMVAEEENENAYSRGAGKSAKLQ